MQTVIMNQERLKCWEAIHDENDGMLKSMNMADKKYDLVLILTFNLRKYNFQNVRKRLKL